MEFIKKVLPKISKVREFAKTFAAKNQKTQTSSIFSKKFILFFAFPIVTNIAFITLSNKMNFDTLVNTVRLLVEKDVDRFTEEVVAEIISLRLDETDKAANFNFWEKEYLSEVVQKMTSGRESHPYIIEIPKGFYAASAFYEDINRNHNIIEFEKQYTNARKIIDTILSGNPGWGQFKDKETKVQYVYCCKPLVSPWLQHIKKEPKWMLFLKVPVDDFSNDSDAITTVLFYAMIIATVLLIYAVLNSVQKFKRMQENEKILKDEFADKNKVLSDQLSDEAQALVMATREAVSTSQNQNTSVKEIVATMENSNSLSQNISERIEDVTSVAKKTTDDVADGAVSLNKNMDKLREILTSNKQTVEGIRSLSMEIDKVWDIVKIITTVADQTKIIAFNAELEAAKAGEAGRNFHSVAEEIRRLSDGILANAKEIKEKISSIQNSSDTLILASESGSIKVDEGIAAARELEDKFEDIKSAAEITADSAYKIAATIQQQAVASGQILSTLRQISASSENFSMATENISDSAGNLKEIADRLNEQQENSI